MRWVKQLRKGDSGNVLIFVAVSIFALAAMAILAIDISKLLVTRAQLQNAADAGALAGAERFVDPNYQTDGVPDKSATEQRAREVAQLNEAYNDSRSDPVSNVAIVSAEAITDVTSPDYGTVTVKTQSVVSQYFTPVVKLPGTGNVGALAAARAGEVYGVSCVKPWCIPDRWDDTGIPGWNGKGANNAKWDHEDFTDQNGNGTWDPGEPFTDGSANNGKLKGPADGQYSAEFYHPILTGYVASKDLGQLLTFKPGRPPAAEPGQYFCIDLPNPDNSETGADRYRDNIANCNPMTVNVGDWLWTENGDMKGPTNQGVKELIDKDPKATWDDDCKCVKSPIYGDNKSPRIVFVPLHDPRVPLMPGKMQIHVVKMIAMFLEGANGGGDIEGRFMKVQAPGHIGPPGGGGYLYNLSLIR